MLQQMTGETKFMKKLLDEMKIKCKEMGITTLLSPQKLGSENVKVFTELGFKEAWTSDE